MLHTNRFFLLLYFLLFHCSQIFKLYKCKTSNNVFPAPHYIVSFTVPDHTSIWTVRVRPGPYKYTRVVRPYAYGPADHTCLGIISYGLNLRKKNNYQTFVVLVLQDVIFTLDG